MTSSLDAPKYFEGWWGCHVDIVVEAFTLYRASTFVSLKIGEVVTLHRSKPEVQKPGGKKVKEDSIVRSVYSEFFVVCISPELKNFLSFSRSFKNSKDIEIGRIAEHDSEWISKLMDIDILTLNGTCVDVPKKFNSGMPQRSSSTLWLCSFHPT